MRAVRTPIAAGPRSATLLAVLFLGGCRPAGDELLTGFGVTFDPTTVELALHRDGGVLLWLPPDGLQLGRVDALDDRRSYDPVFLDTVSVRWEAPRSATVVEEGEGGLEVALDYGEGLT
ncbi:MAG: hypothetical protein JRJ84_20100, partial [Deltaproteobacteria bacterium]|nr:hypothetical protein [Deltaproteobacteria bacterium]